MKKIGVILFFIVIVGLGAYVILPKNAGEVPPRDVNVSNRNGEKPEIVPSIDASDLRQGGSSYREENGIYNFLYPSDFTLDEEDKQHIRIYKTGSTQQGQTEMYDGVLVVFEVITLDGKSLSDWVDNNIKNITADGTSEVTESKKQITLGTYPGFSYVTRGLGESKNYIFQKDNNSKYAVLISTSVSDPGNVGFQKEVDKIVSTLEIFQ